MSQQDDIRLQLSLEADSSIRQTANELGRVDDAIEQIEDGLRNASRAADRAFDSMGDSAKGAVRDVERVTDALERQRIAANQAAQQRFDDVSSQVGLAGDIQSNLGAVSGLAGAAGAGGLASGISVGGEVVALVEELPRLKTALGGFPQTIAAAASALGTTSTGLIGALGAVGVAVAAVTIAFNEFAKQSRELGRLYENQVEAQRRLNSELVNLTSDQIDQRLEIIDFEIEQQERLLATLEGNYREFERQAGIATGFLQTFDPFENELDTSIKDQKQLIDELRAEYNALNGALEENVVLNNDRVAQLEREQEFLELEGEQIIQEASLLSELNEFKQQSIDLTAEEITAKKIELENRKALLQSELQLLETQNNQSEAVKQRINALNTELGQLDGKLKILSETTAKAADEVQEFQGRRAQSRFTRGISLGGGRARSAIPAAVQEVYNEFARSAAEAGGDLSRVLSDVNKNLQRSIQDLRVQQSRDIQDAIRTGDILGIREITSNAARTTEDLNRDAARNRLDIEMDYNTQMIDMAQQRRDAILEAERQIMESTSRIGSALSGVTSNGRGGFSRGFSISLAPRT